MNLRGTALLPDSDGHKQSIAAKVNRRTGIEPSYTRPTQQQINVAGKPATVEFHDYSTEPVFIPTFTVKRRNKRTVATPKFPKHAWSN